MTTETDKKYYETVDSATGSKAMTVRQHNNSGYRNSQAAWLTVPVFAKVQAKIGINDISTDAVLLCVDAINKAYSAGVTVDDFNRSLNALSQKVPVASDTTAAQTVTIEQLNKLVYDALKRGKTETDIKAKLTELKLCDAATMSKLFVTKIVKSVVPKSLF